VARYQVHRSATAGFTPSAANRIATVTAGTSYSDDALPVGTYYYRVIAEDQAGNASAPSTEASASSQADATAPSVSLTTPAAGATVRGSVTVGASAADNVAVTGVQFRLDAANLATEDTTAPYSTNWDTTTATPGPHTLTAIARDAAGNQTTATTVTVTVDNSAPAGPTPIAAYSFEDATGTTLTGTTGNGHTGTIREATWTTTGHTGHALRFDGINDWVTIPDTPELRLGTGMTLEAWVNPTTNTGWRTAILKEQAAGNLAYALYSGGSTVPNTTITTTATTGYGEAIGPTGSAAPTNTWTHLAATYDGTTLRLYKNGTQLTATTRPGTITPGTGPLHLGGNNLWTEWFTGQLDDIRIYNTPLTPTQIQTDMTAPVGVGGT
jgi:Concanavalin A-like lectin/glucanases superfamily/Bacterial Ig domain